ncbi:MULTISPECIES: hypothetical protein [unclassified Frankia]|uniref:hypothetical protein n=1 Tax=unclassified Frankia TaxID=2632575 RepID=UPI002AD3500E|nr:MULTISPECIES: hypothetical protein [unclassified Frankia]
MRTESRQLRFVWLLPTTALILMGTGCGGGGAATGASAPPKVQALDSAGVRSASPSGDRTDLATLAATPAATPSASGSPDLLHMALTTVNAYFEEINKASLEGRVADVSATAMPGCQTCALDIGVTQNFHSQGGHTDVGPLAVSPLTLGPSGEKAITAQMTVAIRAVRLLDTTGNVIKTYPAQPPRAATAMLWLTAAGWRIENVLYSRGPS